MPLVKRQRNSKKASRARARKTMVETDVSSHDNYTDSDDWSNDDDDDDDLGPSDSASSSRVSNNQAPVSPVPKATNLRERNGMDSQAAGWTTNSLGGQPLVLNNGMPYSSGPDWRQGHTQPYQASYETPQEHPSDTNVPYMGYPSNNVQYPTGPDMQGMRPSGASSGAQQELVPYQPTNPKQPTNPNGYYQQQYPHPNQFNPWAKMGYQTAAGTTQMHPTPPPPTTPPPHPRTPKDDPEKIRLEAQIAAFKAMEEKQKALEKQKEAEARIRKEAEEAFHRRMEDMRIAQQEAKREIEKARFLAKEEATKRMQAEQDSEEERSKRFKEFAEKLERDVRAKVELEKIAEMAEQKAKAKQSEDLERLVKLKMLKSMDEIVVLAKKRVLQEVATAREMSVGATEKQGWLIETQGKTKGENKLSRDDDSGEKSHTSVTQSNILPRHATATTLRSVSSASAWRPDVSPTGSRTGSSLAVPDPPVLGYDSDDEGTLGRTGTDTLDASESGRRGRAHHRQQGIYKGQRHRDMFQNGGTQRIEALVDQIADAVVDRLIQSPYKDALIRHPPQSGQYDRHHLRPPRDLFEATPCRSSKDGAFDREDTAGRFHNDGCPGESSKRFFRPPKPAHLRGRSIRGSDVLSSLGMPSDTSPSSSNGAPIAPSNSQTSTPRRTRPPPVSRWLKTSGTRGQFETVSDYSEVDTATQEPPATAVAHAAAGSGETTWDHPDTWMDERPTAVARANESTLREKFEKMKEDNLKAHLSQQEHEEDLRKAYRHIFEDPKFLLRKLPPNLGH